jgi:hypothetical protein
LVYQDQTCSDLWIKSIPLWKIFHFSKAKIKQLAAAGLNPNYLPKTKSNGLLPMFNCPGLLSIATDHSAA